MISASLYIIVCSARNRFARRVRRLREPRYLIGLVVGAAYFYFTIFARTRGRAAATAARRRNAGRAPAAEAITAALAQAGPAASGLVLMFLSVAAWLFPFDSGLLEFSDAETDFLFTAPLSRRQLLAHRLLRSQLGILFASVIIAFASVTSTPWTRVRISIGTWLVLLTMRVYFTIVTLTRSRVAATQGPKRFAALVPPLILTAALAVVSLELARTFFKAPVTHVVEALDRLSAVSLRGLSGVLLGPFVALTQPLFAPTAALFLRALGGTLVVLAVIVAWMLRVDESFQEAAAASASKRAEKAPARRAAVARARATGLSLAPTGPPEPAFFWKNGVQTLRLTGLPLIRIAVATMVVVIAVTSSFVNAMQLRGSAAAVCTISIAIAAFAAVLGPQVVRTDLRSDLMHLDLLKTWPVRPGALIRGEMAWPATMLTCISWMAVAVAAVFSPAAFPRILPATRAAIAGAAFVVLPAIIFAHYLVQNAAALVFPAWVPLGQQRPRGVDAIGQRIILLAGVLVALVVFVVPGLIGGAIIWLAFQRWIGILILVPAAAVCTAIVAVEVLVSTELLGPIYERLDVLSVERPE